METISGSSRHNWGKSREKSVESASDSLERKLKEIEQMSNPEYDAYLASLPNEKLVAFKQELARIVISAIMIVPPVLYFIQKIS